MVAEDAFCQHIPVGVDTLMLVAESASNSANTPLLADILALLVLIASKSGTNLSTAHLKRCLKVAAGVFPGKPQPGAHHITLSSESAACCTSACQLTLAAIQAWYGNTPGNARSNQVQQPAGNAAASKAASREQQLLNLVVNVIIKCLEGMDAIDMAQLPDYVTTAATLLSTWLTSSWQILNNPGACEQVLTGMIMAVPKHLLAALSRCVLGRSL